MTEAPEDRPGSVHRAKARKDWPCAECDVPIAKGTVYMFLNSYDESRRSWSRYILCRTCERIRSCLVVAELACATENSYAAGRLRFEVRDRRLTDNDFNHEYGIAWLASEPSPETTTPDPTEKT